jgi:hypothetical protein
MRVIGDDGTRLDIHSALSDVLGVEVASEVTWSDLARCNGGEV